MNSLDLSENVFLYFYQRSRGNKIQEINLIFRLSDFLYKDAVIKYFFKGKTVCYTCTSFGNKQTNTQTFKLPVPVFTLKGSEVKLKTKNIFSLQLKSICKQD